MTLDQLDLFTEREHRSLGAPPVPNPHGVFDPDETLTLPNAGRHASPLGRIELVHVPSFGWIYSTSYCLGDCYRGSPLMLVRAARGDSRADALQRAVAELLDQMHAILAARDGEGSRARKSAALKVTVWARGLLA